MNSCDIAIFDRVPLYGVGTRLDLALLERPLRPMPRRFLAVPRLEDEGLAPPPPPLVPPPRLLLALAFLLALAVLLLLAPPLGALGCCCLGCSAFQIGRGLTSERIGSRCCVSAARYYHSRVL